MSRCFFVFFYNCSRPIIVENTGMFLKNVGKVAPKIKTYTPAEKK